MVSTTRASNQSSIQQGIAKVVGSSNRGFASIDPERQHSSVAQAGSTLLGKKPAQQSASQELPAASRRIGPPGSGGHSHGKS